MSLDDVFVPFLPIHHLSSDISTHQKWVLPIQMMGEWVST